MYGTKRNAKARTLVNMMMNETNESCVYLDLFSKERKKERKKERRGTVR